MQVLVLDAAEWISRFTVSQLQLAGVDVLVSGMTQAAAERLFPARSGATSVQALDEELFENPGSLRRAFEPLDAVLAAPGGAHAADPARQYRLIRTAFEVGLAHFVRISKCDDERHAAAQAGGVDVNADLKASGLPFTILEPTLMDSVMVEHASEIRDLGIWLGSAPRGRNAFIDPRDVVAATAAVLLQARPMGELYLPGPETLSYAEVAAVLSQLLQRDIFYRVVPPDEQVQAMTAQGLSPSQTRRRLARDAATEHQGEPALNDAVLRLTGRPPGTLGNYLEDHRCIFACAD